MNKHELYMNRCFSLALRAEGHTSPNPLVGCVIVKNNRVIAEGFHKKAGLPHAEAAALKKAGSRAKGAVLYVNLEPCSHTSKRTPPCADAIIQAGIKEVVCAMKDPNPKVSGRGFARLRAAGVRVKTGVLAKEAGELNRVFVKNMEKQMPYVIIKAGMSADGKIALKNSKSKWITSEKSRLHSQSLRKKCDAILVGINTILVDNPYLDCRLEGSKRIKKVVLDTHGRLPLSANIFRNSLPGDIFLLTAKIKKQKIKALEKKGVNVIIVKLKNKVIDARAALRALYERGITSVLVEGGAQTATSFIKNRLVDEAYFYIAPKIIGSDGLGYFGEMGISNTSKIFTLEDTSIKTISGDILLKGRIRYV